jgi:hypothetical protein
MSYSDTPPPPPPPGSGGGYGGYQGGGYGDGYGDGYGGGYAAPQTSKKAIWALVTGILGFCCGPAAIVAIVLGVIGKKDIRESNGRLTGGGMAQAGLILGIIALVLSLVYYALLATGNGFSFTTSP